MADLQVDPIYIIVAILVIVLSILLTRRFRRSSNVVLLVGLSGSGKTSLFTKIIFNKPKQTVISLKPNEASLNDLSLKLVDLPGAERLRPRFWDQYREKARIVIFVVDSATVTSKLRDIGDYLYSLLSDSIIQKNKIGFTVACHKRDMPESKGREEIKTILENELTAIKETKKGQLGRTSEEETEDRLANLFTDKISFDKLKVQLIETSVDNVDQLVKSML